MTVFRIIALLITLTALLSLVNFKFIKLPTAIGVMLMALLVVFSILVQGLSLKQIVRRMMKAASPPMQ